VYNFSLMDKKKVVAWFIVVIVFVVALVWLIGTRNEETMLSDARLTVATTIFPLADIVENVAGEDVRVIRIVSPGASPHSYILTPRQVIELQQAKIVFGIGQGLDDVVVDTVLKSVGDEFETRAVQVDTGIVLRSFGEDKDNGGILTGENVDPHYWLSVPNAKIIAQHVASSLSVIDPLTAERYEENLAAYLAELDELEIELQLVSGGLEQKKFITIHDAWAYFTDQYGLELVGAYEPREGQEPSPSDARDLRQSVIDNGIRVFYTEPQKNSTSATSFFRSLGLEIDVLDPIGGLPGRETYIDMMRANMAAIASQ